jgi:hypothetical protein
MLDKKEGCLASGYAIQRYPKKRNQATETSGPPNQVVALTLTATLPQPPGLLVRPRNGKLGLRNRLVPSANTPFSLGLIPQQTTRRQNSLHN